MRRPLDTRDSMVARWCGGSVAQCLVSGISNYPKWQAQEATQTVELSVILSAA